MLFVIKCIVISIITIVAIHYGIQYLKDTFTVKKIKYESSEIEKYKRVLQEISVATTSPVRGFSEPLQISEFAHDQGPSNDDSVPFFTESAKSEIMNDLDKFLTETVEEQYMDALTKSNTQNNINISFENI